MFLAFKSSPFPVPQLSSENMRHRLWNRQARNLWLRNVHDWQAFIVGISDPKLNQLGKRGDRLRWDINGIGHDQPVLEGFRKASDRPSMWDSTPWRGREV